MRHIKESKITTISADSENESYPIENVQDTHPSKPWKAASGISQAVISAEVTRGVSDVAIFGTNAVSAIVQAYDPNLYGMGDGDTLGDGDTFGNPQFATITVEQFQRSTSRALWLQFDTTIERPANLSITLVAPAGETLYAGLIWANIAETYGGQNPQYGLGISLIDTSIEMEMSNGSRYYKKRNVLRQYSISVLMENSAAFDLIDFFQTYGAIATPWKVTDLNSNEWVVYGTLSQPTAGYDYLNRATINATITEVL